MTRYLLFFLLLPTLAFGQPGAPTAWSNAAYVGVPASVMMTEGISVKTGATAATYGLLTYSSYKMHAARGARWRYWEQLDLDATTLAAAAIAADAYEPLLGKWSWAVVPAAATYYLTTEQRPVINPKDPILHTAIWAGVAFTGLALTEGREAALPLLLFGAAAYVRVGLDADGRGAHAAWHVGSALSAGIALNLDNFELRFGL